MKRGLRIIGLTLAAGLAAALWWLWTPDQPRAALEAKYLRAPSDLQMIAGTRLHVRDEGPRGAPAVIMLHGFGSSLQTWDAWSAVLARHFRIVRFDLPGAGLSSPDPTGRYTDARTMQVLLALMDRLGIDRASLIGNSIGGRIAWTFAANHPDRIDRLVLISPDGFASPGFAYGKPPEIPAMLSAMRYALPRTMLRANLMPSYGDPARLNEATVTRYYELMLAPGARDAMLARMRQTVLTDPAPLLRRIRAPVLLLWGRKDAMIPVGNAQDYRRLLPDNRLVTFTDLGHVPQEEAPSESIAPVMAFLRGDS